MAETKGQQMGVVRKSDSFTEGNISNVVRGRVNRRPAVFRFCICGFELSDRKNVKLCNAGSKPQLSCSTAHNMKSKLINHQSLSCV